MKSLKNLTVITILTILLVSLFTVASLAQTKVLDFIWFTDGDEDIVMQEIIDEYQDMNPDIEINLIETPADQIDQRVRTRVAGGNPPALARLTLPGALEPVLLDLMPYLGEDYLDNFIEATHPYVLINERLVGLPIDVTANGILYNKDLFEQADVEVPTDPNDLWTWDEWADALETVVQNTSARFGAAMDFTAHRWSTLLYQAGGQYFNEDWNEMLINSPEAERAVEFFVELHDRGLMPSSVWLGGENPQTLFRAGLSAIHFSGNWMIANYRDTLDFNWGVTYMPKEARRSSVPGGKYISAFKDSEYADEAADFIKFFSSQEMNAKFIEESLFLSARKDNNQLNYSFGDEMFEVFSNELNASPQVAGNDWANNAVISQISPDIVDAIVDALQHNITPAEAVSRIERIGNEAIEREDN